MALTTQQQVFVSEYIQDFNATRAAIAAGYSERGARVQGHRLLTNANVAAEIKRLVAERVMSADEALIRLSEQAKAAYSAYILEDGTVDLEQMIRDGKAHLIKKIKPTRYGREVEFYDAQTALIHIDNRHRAAPTDNPADEPAGDWWAAAEDQERDTQCQTQAMD